MIIYLMSTSIFIDDEAKSPKINVNKYSKNNFCYNIWNYDKKVLCFDENKSVLNCRSLIKSYPENRILSFSHGKSTSISTFCEKYEYNENIILNEYIDGTLIHLFYDDRINKWEIATKNSIGGHFKLYNKRENVKSNKTVKEMFLQTLTCDMSCYDLNSTKVTNIIQNFPKKNCYQFVLLHPENPIIFPIERPKLYLVSVFEIITKNEIRVCYPYEHWDCFQNSTLCFPRTKKIKSWDEIKANQFELFNKEEELVGYHALHVPSGDRCIFFNPVYKDLLRYKTLNPRELYHYLTIRKLNSVKDFLHYFPKFRNKFSLFKDHLNQYIENLHNAYLAKYVFKKPIENSKYSHYVDLVHREIYIPSINKNKKEKITRKTIHNYIMSKLVPEICYALFEEKRKLLC